MDLYTVQGVQLTPYLPDRAKFSFSVISVFAPPPSFRKPGSRVKAQVLLEQRDISLQVSTQGLSSYVTLTKPPKGTTHMLLDMVIYLLHVEFSLQFWIFLMDALTENCSEIPSGPVPSGYRSFHQSLGKQNSGIPISAACSVLPHPTA